MNNENDAKIDYVAPILDDVIAFKIPLYITGVRESVPLDKRIIEIPPRLMVQNTSFTVMFSMSLSKSCGCKTTYTSILIKYMYKFTFI